MSTKGDYAPLTDEQALAICRFAIGFGRNWKAQLRDCWEWGGTGAVLQNLRNTHGPTWLFHLKLSDIDAQLSKEPIPALVTLTGGDGPVACEASFQAGWDQAITFAVFTVLNCPFARSPLRKAIAEAIETGGKSTWTERRNPPDAKKAPQV